MIEGIASRTHYRALDFGFAVSIDADPLTAEAQWALGDLADAGPARHHYHLQQPSGDPRRRILLTRDREPIGYPVDASEALVRLVSDITAQAVASRPDHLALHAAALGCGERALVLPGRSSAGKSTLAAALVSAGLDYLTDEAAVIDLGSLHVAPFTKPLSLSRDSLAAIGRPVDGSRPADAQTLLPASSLGRGTAGRSVPVGFLVFPSYEPGAVTALTPMSRAEAMIEVADNSFNFIEHGQRWLGALRRLVSACTCMRLRSGDLDTARDLLLTLVDDTEGTAA